MTDEKRGKGIPFVKGSETSADAADSMIKPAGKLRFKVYQYIQSRGSVGATDEEVQDALGMSPNTQRPRRRELETAGKIAKMYFMGKRRTRATQSGRRAGLYAIPEHAQDIPYYQEAQEPEIRSVPDEFIPSDNRELASKFTRVSFLCDIAEKELLGTGGTLPDNEGLREILHSISEAYADAVTKMGNILFKRTLNGDLDQYGGGG